MGRRALLAGLSTLAAASALGLSPLPRAVPELAKPPGGSGGGVTLMWSAPQHHAWTWDFAVAKAEIYEEDGFDDWRMPTLDEVTEAIAAGEYPTTENYPYWTGNQRGKRYAWVVWADDGAVEIFLKDSAIFDIYFLLVWFCSCGSDFYYGTGWETRLFTISKITYFKSAMTLILD